MKKTKASVNYGIQAGNVQAAAIAVGPHAQATAAAAPERDNALAKLADAVAQLQMSAEQQRAILDHLNGMKTEPSQHHAFTFDKVLSVVKDAGRAVELLAPLKAVAAAFGLALPF